MPSDRPSFTNPRRELTSAPPAAAETSKRPGFSSGGRPTPAAQLTNEARPSFGSRSPVALPSRPPASFAAPKDLANRPPRRSAPAPVLPHALQPEVESSGAVPSAAGTTQRFRAYKAPFVRAFGVAAGLVMLALAGWGGTHWYVSRAASSAPVAAPASAPVQAPRAVVAPTSVPVPVPAPVAVTQLLAPAPTHPSPSVADSHEDTSTSQEHAHGDRTMRQQTARAPIYNRPPAGRSAADDARCAALNRKLQVDTPTAEELQFLRNGCKSR